MERIKDKDNGISYDNRSSGTKARSLTYGSLMAALVFVSTYLIKIPISFTQGYIHAGDSMIFVAALLFGWRFGALAGGLGSAMADVLGGYAHWAFPTLIIKAVMGALVGWVGHDLPKKENHRQISTLLITGVTVLWLIFCFSLKNLVNQTFLAKPLVLLGQLSEVATLEEMTVLVQRVNFGLLLVAIAVPLGILVLAYYLNRLNLKFFGVSQLLGMFIAGLWMVAGYYVAAGFMYGSFIVPIFDIPSNMVQFLGGLTIAYLVLIALQKTGALKFL